VTPAPTSGSLPEVDPDDTLEDWPEEAPTLPTRGDPPDLSDPTHEPFVIVRRVTPEADDARR
jgi:hypothetical protein